MSRRGPGIAAVAGLAAALGVAGCWLLFTSFKTYDDEGYVLLSLAHFARGGRLYGHYPEDVSPGNNLDTGRGRLIPTTSVDAYSCELALWLGVDRSHIPFTLPNIERFYDLRNDRTPLGLFG